MFSISHGPDGSFRLDIHSSPGDLDPVDARRLRAVLFALARELDEERGSENDGSRPDDSNETRPDTFRSERKAPGPVD